VTVNEFIALGSSLPKTQQQESIAQDNAKKASFAMDMLKRMPQEPPKEQPPVKIPSLGAMAVPN
jgi:hypothetical protein